jgi:hypothetical protein
MRERRRTARGQRAQSSGAAFGEVVRATGRRMRRTVGCFRGFA